MGEEPEKPKPRPKRVPPSSAQVTAAISSPHLSQGPRAPQAHRALPIGSMLGKYRIVAILGHGGMGNVYAAEDPMIKRRVAIKVLPPEFARDKGLIDRLLAEAQAAGKLNHPNVVTIYDVNHVNDHYFIVMELLPGGSVQDYLANKGSPGWRAATKLVGEACKALAAAHDIGLIHRDIKPSNLMLTSDGHVKVADFGLAKIEAPDATMHTQPGTILGTPAFMSPEQCRGDKVDLRTDLYSLGCSYFAMLTGKPPFEAASSMQVMFAHCSAPIPDPRTVADVPEGCIHVLQKSLAKNPDERYASAKEMLADLRAVLSGGSVSSMQTLQALAQAAPKEPEVFEPPQLPTAQRRSKSPVGLFIGIGAAVIVLACLIIVLATRSGSKQIASVDPTTIAQPKPASPPVVKEAAPPPPPVPVVQAPATAPAIVTNTPTTQPALVPVPVAKEVIASALPIPPKLDQPPASAPVAVAPAPAPIEKSSEPEVTLPGRIVNSIGEGLTLIPAGHFIMGDKEFKDAPPHPVKITHAFYMGETEVTQGELVKVLGQQVAERIQHDELPAAFTSWEEAQRFCKLLSEMPAEKAAGRTYRLPTEAEWEYACRAGTRTRYSFGDTLTKNDANFGKDITILYRRMEERREGQQPPPRPGQGNRPPPRGGRNEPPPPDQSQGQQPDPSQDRSQHPLEAAGSYPPNAWGLHDMHGSVWEWCSDFYDPSAYRHEEATDPTGPPTGKSHVARGGCWSSFAAECASGYRNGKAQPNQREPSYGFRVVCEVKPLK